MKNFALTETSLYNVNLKSYEGIFVRLNIDGKLRVYFKTGNKAKHLQTIELSSLPFTYEYYKGYPFRVYEGFQKPIYSTIVPTQNRYVLAFNLEIAYRDYLKTFK